MTLARWLRRLAAGALLFLVTVVVYDALRWAGFRFRWETEPVATAGLEPATREPAAREPVSRAEASSEVERVPARPAASVPSPADEPTNEPADERSDGRTRDGRTRDGPPLGARGPIDFETFPDGSAVCAPCPISDEYAAFGVRFSFRSWSASSPLPFLVDAGEYLPEGDPSPFRVGPALADAGSMEVGVIRLDLRGRPTRVTFEVVGPSLIERFDVTAWSAGSRIESEEIPRFRARTYGAAGGGRFRSETVAVETPAGIDRIELDGWGPPGHLLLIDHLVIGGGRGGGP